MDSLAANLSKYLELVERDSPKKRKAEHSSESYIWDLAPKNKNKRKHPYTNRVGSHDEMMRQHYRARISAAKAKGFCCQHYLMQSYGEWSRSKRCGRNRSENFTFFWSSRNWKIDLKLIGFAISNPTWAVNWGDGSRFYVKQSSSQSQKKGCNYWRYTHSGAM